MAAATKPCLVACANVATTKRLERYVPKVVWGNRFVSFVRTYARGLERKAPKIRNVWNGMFQRLATFGTVRSKGCQRLERYVPKVANV